MIFWRPLFGVLLAFVLALSSGTMAVARGQKPMGDALVICAGYGTATVYLDSNGNPQEPVHPCPDCLSGVLAFLAPSQAWPVSRPNTLSRFVPPEAAQLDVGVQHRAPSARGPPVPV